MKKVLGVLSGALLVLLINAAGVGAAGFMESSQPKSNGQRSKVNRQDSYQKKDQNKDQYENNGSTSFRQVPEPGSLLLLGAGLLGLGVLRNRKP